MRLVVFLVIAAHACAAGAEPRDGPGEPQQKPGYVQTEAPDKQVEYVTGPNVGIVGPTVLGGKGQEVQPSGQELQSTDKEQRDVSSQYSGYQQVSAEEEEEEESKEQTNEATYPKYSFGEGVKYVQGEESDEQTEKESLQQKKNQVIEIGNTHRPSKVTYYQSGGSREPPTPPEPNYYRYIPVPQNQELSSAQLLARLRTHQLNQLLTRPSEYQQVAAQNHRQEAERGNPQSHVSKSVGSPSQAAHSAEDHERAPPANASPVYIPQEYFQYQISAAQDDLQSTPPGKHVLQLYLPQEGASGHINVDARQQQVVPLRSNPNLQPIHNGQQIQYIPAYYSSQPHLQVQNSHHPAHQTPTAQRILPNQVVSQPATHTQKPHSSNAALPPAYQRPQLHPQLYSNFQPSQIQTPSPFSNEPTQYHLFQQSNEDAKQPQKIYQQSKQTAQPTQHVQKPIEQPSNTYVQSYNQPTIYRPKTPERLPQRQPENLALVSQSPPKITQHRQTHDKPPQLLQPQERPQAPQPHERPQAIQSHDRPQSYQPHDRPQSYQPHDRPQSYQPHDRPHTLQPNQVYQTESIQPTDYKLSATLQNSPYTIQKLQSPLHIQSPTPFPVKVISLQPQAQAQSQAQSPLNYQLPNDKAVSFRPSIYPVPSKFGQAVQTESPESLGLIPTEAAKLYNVKIPSYIKAFEQAGHTKPFGFSQMSYGQSPGSYSYSIFNKHS